MVERNRKHEGKHCGGGHTKQTQAAPVLLRDVGGYTFHLGHDLRRLSCTAASAAPSGEIERTL